MSDRNGHGKSPWGGVLDPIAVNRLHAITENATAQSRQFARNLADPRRDIEDECGYPRLDEAISTELYKQLYDRDPVAARIVEVLPKESWQTYPEVEGPAEFVAALKELEKGLNPSGRSWHESEDSSPICSACVRADVLSRIGRFGLLLIGFDDGLRLDVPVAGSVVVRNGRNVSDSPPDPDEAETTHAVRNAEGEKETRTRLPELRQLEADRTENPTVNRYYGQDGGEYGRDERWTPTYNGDPGPAGTRNRVGDSFGESRSPNRPAGIDGDAAPDWAKVGPTGESYLPDNLAMGLGALGSDGQYFGTQFGPPEQTGTDPEDRPEGRRLGVKFLRPYSESLVQVVRWESNFRSPRFGAPVMYRVTLNDPRAAYSGIGLPLATVMVHWSRVIHLADNYATAGDANPYLAPPALQQPLNNVLALRKVYAGAGEGYWQACVAIKQFSTHPALGGDVVLDAGNLRDQAEQARNGLQRELTSVGGKWELLAPTVPALTEQVDKNIEAICVKVPCPKRVFMGSERGELASAQDDSKWNDEKRARQKFYIVPSIIAPLLDRFILVGTLPDPGDAGYTVRFPDPESESAKDRAGILLQRTQALAAYVSGGLAAQMSPEDYYEREMGYDAEEAKDIVRAAERHQEDSLDAHGDLADAAAEHDLQKTPPAGFEPKPESPPPGTGMPGGPPMPPQKLGAGQSLVHPQTGAEIAKGPPAPKPAAPKPPGA